MQGETYFKIIHIGCFRTIADHGIVDLEYFLCEDQPQAETGNMLAVLPPEEVVKNILLLVRANGMPAVADTDM